MKKSILVGIVYLLWEFVFGGVGLVRADGRHGGHRDHRPSFRIIVAAPVYRYPHYPVYNPAPIYRQYPVYRPVPVYYPQSQQVIIQEKVVVVEKPVYVERENSSSIAPAPKNWDEPTGEFQGQLGNGPVRCTEEQLRRGKVPMGTSGWLQDLESLKRCYYDLTKIQY